ncbi:MAG: DUF3179 domain-containing protein [Gammaproteobacteria bacterium]|nr:DUF3179 domain-containing protein [Gammaproteobacteria bacterium]
MVPTIEGKTYNFVNSGLYDGLFVLEDKETRTLWSHMTGEGLYGPHASYKMPVSNLLQMNVAQAMAMDSDMVIAISDRPYKNGTGFTNGRWNPENLDAKLMPAFVETLGDEDERLDRMAMGLGIWTDDTRRYYPTETIRARGKYLVDEIEGRKLLIVLDPLTSTPTALYWNTDEATIEGRDILLDDGFKISNGVLYDSEGELVEVERPQQLFTRWYGFALTFPGSEIIE